MRAVLDAGPIIHLSWVDRLDLLSELLDEIFLPPAVREEVLAAPSGTLGRDRIEKALAQGRWRVLGLRTPASSAPVAISSLGRGEAQAIALAEEIGADLLITDDAEARKVALQRGLGVTGTLGPLKASREKGLIPAVLPLLLELRRLGLWIGEGLVQEVRQEEGRGGPPRRS